MCDLLLEAPFTSRKSPVFDSIRNVRRPSHRANDVVCIFDAVVAVVVADERLVVFSVPAFVAVVVIVVSVLSKSSVELVDEIALRPPNAEIKGRTFARH